MPFFERFLSVWVGLAIVAGVALAHHHLPRRHAHFKHGVAHDVEALGAQR